MEDKKFYITTTLPYVNAPLHMGHALEFVRVDALARYKKLQGYDVYFNTGTDEHGVKIFEKAKDKGVEVQDFVNAGFATFVSQLEMFGIGVGGSAVVPHYIRTTDKVHEKFAQLFWQAVADKGYIYKDTYEAKYCNGCESEKTDSDLNEAGFCPDHNGIPLAHISEENYFFKYSAFGPKLLDFYAQNPNFVVPDFRFNEIKEFIKRGLQDFSISRKKEKMPWGIPVLGDDSQVMYVWFDALTNYVSTFLKSSNTDIESIQSLADLKQNKNFIDFWQNTGALQYCGKDNLRFQSAMWQAMLIAADLPNSKQIVINGFITGDGGVKMSKTLGNTVDPRDIVAEYGTDALRYFLLAEISNFEDSPFTIERFKDSYNSALANGLGNLTSRIMTMAENYQVDNSAAKNILTKDFSSLKDEDFILPDYFNYLEKFEIKNAIGVVFFNLIKDINEQISEKEPFKVFKTDPVLARNIVFGLLNELAIVSRLLEPFMPETAQKIQDLILQNKKPEAPLFLRKD